MPVTLPNLDDRRWTDLTDEARALIPVLAPTWTDQNPSDPGITLLELLAWVTEQDIYRVNRISARQRALLLSLAGLTPLPPQPARLLLQFSTSVTAGTQAPAGWEFAAHAGEPGEIRYRTLEDVRAVVAAIDSVLTVEQGITQDLSFALRRRGRGWIFGPNAAAGVSLYLGLSAVPPAGSLSVGFHFAGSRTDAAERASILQEYQNIPPHHDVRLRWEAWTLGGWAELSVDDGTRALTLDGTLRLTLPAGCSVMTMEGLAPRFYLRCTLTSGAYDRPPELKQVFLNAAVAEQASAFGVAAAPAVMPVVGSSTGDPFQTLPMPGGMVVRDSVELYSLEQGTWRQWQRVEDFAASRPADAHFLLDAGSGVITFGDGNQGRLALADSPFAATWRNTKGAAGMVVAGSVITPAQPVGGLTVLNPAASQGGADAETLTAAIGRGIELREASLRAITNQDIRTLTTETPGALVARAEVRPNHYPGLKCVTAHGVTCVVVLPVGSGPQPAPSPGLLALVRRRLERTRIVGSRFLVIGPHYVEVTVHASVKSRSIAAPVLRARVMAALDQFFHPITGGPAGTDWPLGRDVYRSEVMQVLDGVDGVDYVAALELTATQCPASCGNLCLEPLALAASGAHEIEVL